MTPNLLVHVYENQSPDLRHTREGIFAFVLWNAAARVLGAARDRFGEKPLCYADGDGQLVVASEATALTRTRTALAPSASSLAVVDQYSALGYAQSPSTISEGIRYGARSFCTCATACRRRRRRADFNAPARRERLP